MSERSVYNRRKREQPTSEQISRALYMYGNKEHAARALGFSARSLATWINERPDLEKYRNRESNLVGE